MFHMRYWITSLPDRHITSFDTLYAVSILWLPELVIKRLTAIETSQRRNEAGGPCLVEVDQCSVSTIIHSMLMPNV